MGPSVVWGDPVYLFKYVFRLFSSSSCSSSYLSSFCSSYGTHAHLGPRPPQCWCFCITWRTHVVRIVSTNDKLVAKGR